MSEPRRHHFLPAAYLGGFTKEGGRDGSLWVFDLEQRKWRPSKPENEAHRRDFYKIEDHAGDPMELEKLLGKDLEGHAIRAITGITTTKRLPEVKDLEYLISFVGLLATRVPAHRRRLNGWFKSINKHVMRAVLSSKELYESTARRARAAGEDIPDASYESVKEFMERGEYTVEVNQDYHLQNMLKLASTIVDCLYQRNWCLLIAEPGFRFICGENPVALTWSNGFKPKSLLSPGFGLKNTEVFVPLTDELALLGSFAENLPIEATATEKGVAMFNSRTLERTDRFIYSSTQEILWMKKNGNMGNFGDLPQQQKKE